MASATSRRDVLNLVFRALGATTTALFAVQAVWIFLNPPTLSMFKLCHWLGQGLLCIFAGAAGCYLELKGGRALVEAQTAKFVLNRVLLSVFYFWLGCYVMDVSNYSFWQETLAHITGVLAWVVSAGNLVVSCAVGGARGEGQGDNPAAPANTSNEQNFVNVAATSAPDIEAGSMEPTAPAPAGGWNTTWTHKDRQNIVAENAPDGGWNTAWTSPFGTK